MKNWNWSIFTCRNSSILSKLSSSISKRTSRKVSDVFSPALDSPIKSNAKEKNIPFIIIRLNLIKSRTETSINEYKPFSFGFENQNKRFPFRFKKKKKNEPKRYTFCRFIKTQDLCRTNTARHPHNKYKLVKMRFKERNEINRNKCEPTFFFSFRKVECSTMKRVFNWRTITFNEELFVTIFSPFQQTEEHAFFKQRTKMKNVYFQHSSWGNEIDFNILLIQRSQTPLASKIEMYSSKYLL